MLLTAPGAIDSVVVGNEAVGPYVLLRLERNGIEPGVPGQFFMLEAPGRLLPRPMSLCLAPPGELAFLLDPIGPGTRALAALRAGDGIHVLGPLGNGFDLEVERPLLVAGGIGLAPMPYLSRGSAVGHLRFSASGPSVTPKRRGSCPAPRSSSSLGSSPSSFPTIPATCSRAVPSRCWRPCASSPRAPSSPGRPRWPAATARASAVSSKSRVATSVFASTDQCYESLQLIERDKPGSDP